MFIPKPFKMVDKSAMQSFIRQFGFASMISHQENVGITATHLPFELREDQGEHGTLYCHFAKANFHWRALNGTQVMVIFSGPHSYISPTWYTSAPAVPTWNYTAVHAYGVVTQLSSKQTLEVVRSMVQKYEPELLAKPTILTAEYTDRLLSAIVGVKIEITQLEGQLKLGQHRHKKDQQGVFEGLAHSADSNAQALADYMQTIGVGTGH